MPHYENHLFFCTNQRDDTAKRPCCAAAGAVALREYAKKRAKELGLPRTRVNAAGCLDQCEKGPVLVIYPEGIWYNYKTETDIDEILASLQTGQPVLRLLLNLPSAQKTAG